MTKTNERWRNVRQAERGSALVAVLLLLLVMSALAAALGLSGTTETLVTRNHQLLAQAGAEIGDAEAVHQSGHDDGAEAEQESAGGLARSGGREKGAARRARSGAG